jgi:hypothetical protein
MSSGAGLANTRELSHPVTAPATRLRIKPTTMNANTDFSYCVHGLLVQSGFEFPELLAVSQAGPGAVLDPRPARVAMASLPETIDHQSVSKDGYLIGDGRVFMALTNGIRCLVEAGEKVTIDPGIDEAMPAARLFALSAGLGTLLHQRGYIPVHCAAIDTPAGCVVFAGNAGDGKSTLAASLSGAGFMLFTDDRLTIHPSGQSPYTAVPSVPVLHLFDDGAGLAGLDGSELAVNSYRFGKHVHLVPRRYASSPRPVAGLYFTDWHEDASAAPAITPMGSIDAMMRLRRDVSLAHLVELLGQETRFLSWAAGLCRSVPVFSLKRPRDRARHGESLDLIISHVRDTFFP